MKKLILFFSVLFLAVGCSDEKLENDLSKENLFGKVKSVETTTFYAIDSSGTIVKNGVSEVFPIIMNEYNEFGNLVKTKKFNFKYPKRYNRNIFSYNNLNKLVEEKFYFNDNQLYRNVFYTYNEINNLVEVNINDNLPEGLSNVKKILKYDDKNNLIEELYYENSIYLMKEVFKYDVENKITESRYYFEESIRYKKIYDKKENLIEEIEYDSLTNVKAKWSYIYDKKGNEIEARRVLKDTVFHFKIISKYDKYNNPIQKINFSNKDVADSGNIYKYEYDKKGNWIKKIHFENYHLALDKIYLFPMFPPESYFLPEYIIERKIEYYE